MRKKAKNMTNNYGSLGNTLGKCIVCKRLVVVISYGHWNL